MADPAALLQEMTARLAASARLEPAVRTEAAREARQLMAAVLGLSPAALGLRLRSGEPLAEEVTGAIRRATERRCRGEPLAYAVGTAAFRHLVLAVDARVLIPRPETEEVVQVALDLTRGQSGGTAVDIGTGSGAIALSLATEGTFDRVVATDLSEDALTVARANAERLSPRTPVEFRAGSDLEPVSGLTARLLVSNPPYIAYEEALTLPAAVRDWEPPTALFAPEEGMARYRALLAGARALLEPGGWFVFEVDARRGQRTADLARTAGFASVRLMCDLSGRDRILVGQRPSDA